MDYRRQKVTSLSPVSAARQASLTLSHVPYEQPATTMSLQTQESVLSNRP